MQPFVVGFNRRLDHEFRRHIINLAAPTIEQILLAIFRALGFDQPEMFFDFKAVVLEINELDRLIGRVRLACREYRRARHGSNPIERVFVEVDHAFERVMLQNLALDHLVVFRLADHCRNRHDYRRASAAHDRVKQLANESQLRKMRRFLLLCLRIRRVHQTDGHSAAEQLQFACSFRQEIGAEQIALTVTAQDHVRRRDRKHVVADFDAVNLRLLDPIALAGRFRRLEHAMHCGD